MDVKDEMQALGLAPMSWDEAATAAKEKLPPADRATFHRLHNNFTGYNSPETLNRFYGFVFSRGIQFEINNFRFPRLEGILQSLLPLLKPEHSILDLGAGSGIISTLILKNVHPRALVLQDPCREVRDYLLSMGFSVLPHPAPASPPDRFDRILAVDCLGELNSDEDDSLLNGDGSLLDRIRLVEQAYGFGQKLEAWKSYLAPEGQILLWEPIRHRSAWEAIQGHLLDYGWKVELFGDNPKNTHLRLSARENHEPRNS